jgi:hypothetical protein
MSLPDLLGNILLLREQRVMLSGDLASLYEVEPRALIQAVQRNSERFPEDFMFQLSRDEWLNLKSQNVISSWGGSRTPPYAFSEQGVAMLSSVLKSSRAVQVNIEIMRTFIRLRRILTENSDLSHRLDEMEQHYDEQFKTVFDALRQLMTPSINPGRPMGFIQNGQRDIP